LAIPAESNDSPEVGNHPTAGFRMMDGLVRQVSPSLTGEIALLIS
jgi:hypothetical protein